MKRLGIEADSATVSLERSLAKELSKVEIVPTDSLVERLRIVKDKDEIEETRACVSASGAGVRGRQGAADAGDDASSTSRPSWSTRHGGSARRR